MRNSFPIYLNRFHRSPPVPRPLYGGTGLGLAISKNIVDLMDGHIEVRSIKGIGTEFTVDARLGITEEELLQSRKKAQIYNFAHLKTLVVDDDVAACDQCGRYIKRNRDHRRMGGQRQ